MFIHKGNWKTNLYYCISIFTTFTRSVSVGLYCDNLHRQSVSNHIFPKFPVCFLLWMSKVKPWWQSVNHQTQMGICQIENDNICFKTRFGENFLAFIYNIILHHMHLSIILKLNDKLYRQSFSNYKFCMFPVRFLLRIRKDNL